MSGLNLSICRNPTQPASSRSKAVDSSVAHRFQTVRCPGRVFPVSDKPVRFCCYDDCIMLPKEKRVIYERFCCIQAIFIIFLCCTSVQFFDIIHIVFQTTDSESKKINSESFIYSAVFSP